VSLKQFHASTGVQESFCESCLAKTPSHRCMTGNKVDGKFLCVFCEDGEKCPNDAMRPAQKNSEKETKVMSTGLTQCLCGCGGMASSRWKYIRGHKPADGGATSTAPKKKVAMPRKPSSSNSVIADPDGETATIAVKRSALDLWWQKLNVHQKADAFVSFMEAGL
jgi:hypothetical protein